MVPINRFAGSSAPSPIGHAPPPFPTITREFEPASMEVGAARRFVLDVLGPERANRDVAALLVSELAANAVRHAQTSFVVAISVHANVYGEVRDGSPRPPRLAAAPDPCGEGGRGLVMVNRLADAWGYQPTAEGKTVWFKTGAKSW